SVVSTHVIAPLRERASLLHVGLRSVERGAPEMELIVHIRGVSRESQRVFLRGFIPLLGLLVIHAALEVLIAFFCESRHGNGQQAEGENKGYKCASPNIVSHGYLLERWKFKAT